ncbi:cysteine methyltransferase [Sphingomonas melonis TY]|jgi:methylated-DNA-[protein]-cysteine S-methyltransferase|uniref:Methylated-DNA--protein-cysteine methyltransferase n=1 Tax=Sphingomonas melonis TY TaxID=621456 RepID=A0A175Y1L7_9SPHN|nr:MULTISPECIES: methylated-DNA--[protein]-cysteine S-methyltransferase [Sphingomonas]AOW24367.1 cysteine methyltransferase [Sphingomonas melonis TY]ATI55432.1 methylated-DNA--[protein]-cysteine S-methyltransferase [Sphingomonas melonis]KZB93860.1 cysteine methyltransferase [Sphingomonas melonis TY]MBI0531370.1 methylated-DNA--[protein]-cysteine S-methyltransferase [Sphingomonas sp. TX0522]MBX8843894.1 methylated-DNA--[protein]-cysteine S-methyltransferase [Sphingomonas melonis]
MTLAATRLDSPVGVLTLVASDVGLVAVLWPDDDPRRVPLPTLGQHDDHPMLRAATAQLTAYFAGERRVFDVPLDMRGTDFQKAVWAALLTIPYGQTRSYGAIALALGRPDASRAVGAANGRNPISIIVPCHRVVGSTGKLTGFAGGMTAKAHLLALERRDGELPFG